MAEKKKPWIGKSGTCTGKVVEVAEMNLLLVNPLVLEDFVVVGENTKSNFILGTDQYRIFCMQMCEIRNSP